MGSRADCNKLDKVLIVGYGSIGQRHLRIARSFLPNANIQILRHQISNETPPDQANGVLYKITDALAFGPQIAVISSPAAFHLTSAQALIDAGVHLLIEKPLSSNLDNVDKLLESWRRVNVVLMIGYNLRFLPSLQYFRKAIIEKKFIGKVLSVRCEAGQYLPSWRPNIDYRESVSANLDLGGGAMLELSHELDYLRWIFGDVAWVKSTLSQQSNLVLNVEDSVSLIMGFAPKGGDRQLICSVNLDFIRQDSTRICTAIGEEGTIKWNGLTGEVSLFRRGAKDWIVLFSFQHQRDDSYFAEWEHFLSCVNSNSMPLVSGYDGYKVLQIIESAKIASSSGAQVSVPLIFNDKDS